MISLKIISFLFCTTVGLTASSFALTYVVQHKNESLSGIAQNNIEGKIYGRQGSLAKILVLNPKIKNPNLIFLGQKINLGEIKSVPVAKVEKENLPTGHKEANHINRQVSANEVQPTPAKSAAEIVYTKEKGYSLVSVEQNFIYLRIDGTDKSNGSKASLLSGLSPTTTLKWTQVWSKKLETHLGIGLTQIKIQSSNSRTLTGKDQNLSKLIIGSSYVYKPDIKLHLNVEAAEDLFYHSVSTTTVAIERVMIPNIGAGLSWDFYKTIPFTLGGRIDLLYLASAKTDDLDIKSGYGHRESFYIKQEFEKSWLSHLGGSIFYEDKIQGTAALGRHQKEVGLGISLSGEFGK